MAELEAICFVQLTNTTKYMYIETNDIAILD